MKNIFNEMTKELLDDFQKTVLKGFGKSELAEKFYWSGGTALAYHYLKHRQSFDLDFFSEDLFSDEWILTEVNKIKEMAEITKSEYQKKINRWLFFLHRGNEVLKFELVYYPFPLIDKPKIDNNFQIKVDSLLDIATNKVQTIFERQEPKDVFDLYWILKKEKVSLDKLFDLAERKFGSSIDPVTWAARAILAAEGLDNLKPLTFKDYSVKPATLESFFQNYSFKDLKKKLE